MKISKREKKNDLISLKQFGSGGFVETYLNAVLCLDESNRAAYDKYSEACATFRFDWWTF